MNKNSTYGSIFIFARTMGVIVVTFSQITVEPTKATEKVDEKVWITSNSVSSPSFLIAQRSTRPAPMPSLPDIQPTSRWWEYCMGGIGLNEHEAPDRQRAWENYLLGSNCYRDQEWQTAANAFTLAITFDPSFIPPYVGRGDALIELNRLDEAITDYNRVIQLNPQEEIPWVKDKEQMIQPVAWAYTGLCKVYLRKGNTDMAIDNCDQAIQIDPDFADAYVTRSTIHETIGSEQAAIDDLTQALQVYPKYAEAHFKLGLLYQKQGNLEQAEASFSQAILKRENYVEAYRKRVEVRDARGNTEGAYEDLQTIARIYFEQRRMADYEKIRQELVRRYEQSSSQ